MSRERLADAYEEQAALYARLADATAQVAHELRGIQQPGAAGVSPPSPSVAPADPDEPPPLKPQVDAGLGVCPIHGVPWTVKPAGVSAKTKKRYRAFWKCDAKDADGYCNEKPQWIWVDSHPIEEGAAA